MKDFSLIFKDLMTLSHGTYVGLLMGCWIACAMPLLGQTLPPVKWRHLDVRDGLPEYFDTHGILQDRLGRVWIGHDRGFCSYDGYDLVHYYTTSTDPYSISEENVQGLYEADDGHIWISLRTRGIAIYDPVTDRFTALLPHTLGGKLPEQRFWQFAPGDNNTLWVGSERGLLEFNLRDSTSQIHRVQFDTASADRNDFYNIVRDLVIHPQDAGKLLLGAGGLLEFDISSRVFTHLPMPYSSVAEVGMSKPNYLILDMELPHESTVWLTTWSGGTMTFDLSDKTWNRIRNPAHRNPLVEDIGHRIVSKNREEAWYAGNEGFGLVNFTTGQYSFYRNDPSDVHSIRPSAALDFLFTTDSTLIVCGLLGVSIADPYPGYQAGREQKIPMITSIAINGNQLKGDTSVAFVRTLKLDHDQNSLVFKVAVPVFFQPDSMRYRFRLKGRDEDWIESGRRTVEYHNLKGGSYTFHYQASRDGVTWTDGRTTPRIRIEVLFWQHPLFVAACILGAGLLAFAFHTIRVRQIRKEQNLKSEFNKKLASVEMSALRAQMNPHFMFNSLNSIKTYILKEKTEEASSYLTKFSQLMRSVLNNSKSVLVPLQEELKALRLYIELEALRFEGEFNYVIDIDERVPIDQIVLPPLLIQPYVENAIRHGLLEKETGQRLLAIRIFLLNDSMLVVKIEDNGVGRSHPGKQQENGMRNKSYGMQITRDRIALLEETLGITTEVRITDLYASDGKPAGTLVEIQIPRLTIAQMHAFSDPLT